MNAKINKCLWIGDGERCDSDALIDKNYCKIHYDRVYTTMYPEMAEYIIERQHTSVDSLVIKYYN